MSEAATPVILAADSGLGGLTIVAEIRKAMPQARLAYLCDNAFFPYGTRPDAALLSHFLGVMNRAIERVRPDLVVTACNTISTICLPQLRAATSIPVVGVVPAIKPAAQQSRRKIIGLLATPATINRPYTDDLIQRYAADCTVLKVGSAELVQMAEVKLLGETVDRDRLRHILSPFFDRSAATQPDVIVLACTHFPLLRAEFQAVGPADVVWVDSGVAVARRVVDVLPLPRGSSIEADLALTSAACDPAMRRALAQFGLAEVETLPG
ncbi:glutamate racemase [Dongia deserti]|uniref:glutamate racemase n=1 Tax=Dongia deserti TaxID=2268030 RepID=UPI000E65B556|nr:glutamate racemase [Dongia deserti]